MVATVFRTKQPHFIVNVKSVTAAMLYLRLGSEHDKTLMLLLHSQDLINKNRAVNLES